MSIDSSELTYQIACQNISKIKQRYNQANASKGFWFKMVSSGELRFEQISRLENLVAGITQMQERLIQTRVLTDEFNLSAVRGCYLSILSEIQATYKNPADFTNSKLVKILLSDLKIEELPDPQETKQAQENYEQVLFSIDVAIAKRDSIHSI